MANSKELITFQGSYKTWLCNIALLALICVAFAVGILIGPVIASRKCSVMEKHCTPRRDGIITSEATGEHAKGSRCISQTDLVAILRDWSHSMEDVIEEKLVNISKKKINHALRKLSKAKNASTRKTIKELKDAILVNWTEKFSQLMNKLLAETTRETQSNKTGNVKEKNVTESTPRPELIIDMDTADSTTQAVRTSVPVPVALYPLNAKFTTWDISGRGNPNSIARGMRLAPGPDGRPNGSYQFFDSGSYFALPDTGVLNNKGSITLLVWVYMHTKHGPILSYNSRGLRVSLEVKPKGELSAKLASHDNSHVVDLTSSSPITSEAWSYIGASYNHVSGLAKLWINGHVCRQKNIGALLKVSTDKSVRLEASALHDGNHFNGRITRVQVYDMALSQGEIEAVRGPIEAGVCPQGWTGYHSSCYLLFNRLTSQWNQARQVCRQHGADLVKIESPEENHFVYALARSKATTRRYMWIGLLRGSPGESFSWVNDPSPTLYSNWASGEPNDDYSRGENCGHMYIKKSPRATQWNDELCVNPTIGPMIFMCEKTAVEPGTGSETTKPVETGNSIDGEGSGAESGSGDDSGQSASGWKSYDEETPRTTGTR